MIKEYWEQGKDIVSGLGEGLGYACLGVLILAAFLLLAVVVGAVILGIQAAVLGFFLYLALLLGHAMLPAIPAVSYLTAAAISFVVIVASRLIFSGVGMITVDKN